MRRAWIGIAFLSASWLPGLGIYHDPNWIIWAAFVSLGTASLLGTTVKIPCRKTNLIAGTLLLPTLIVAPWPYRAAILLLFCGLLLSAMPIPRRWPGHLAGATMAAGAILTVQAFCLFVYESLTARSHELPEALAQLLYGVARGLGVQAALDGTALALHSIRRVHLLGATWELLLDPATLAFLAGGAVLLCLRTSGAKNRGQAIRRFVSALATLTLTVLLWLPIRAGLLIAVYLHRALTTEYMTPLTLMNQFWNTWVLLALLLGPVLLAIRFVRVIPAAPAPAPTMPTTPLRRIVSLALIVVGSLLLILALVWDPTGPRKEGRIWVDEHRSTWERTDRPYDPNWYGQESGYNYACIYDYCSRFYEMGRLLTPIDANTLSDCDVLLVKVPTARYSDQEIVWIEQFVQDGGGLLLIGEHTNVFNTGTYLNDIASPFGFRFRYDCLFDIDTVFDQLYRPPVVPHPIVQHMPAMDFAVSCSIDPGLSSGRAAIQAGGLRSLPADYHASNYYPQVTDRAEARYGAFVQLWTACHGAGRVAGFGDSTIFSNFSTFEPGKAELMLGMLEWLNHRNKTSDARPIIALSGALLLIAGLVVSLAQTGGGFVSLSGILLGVTLAGVFANGIHRKAMPTPEPKRPFTHVVIDRTVCDSPLSKSGFIQGVDNGFGIFERWILRLGYFTSRRTGREAFTGEALVLLYPNQEVSADYRRRLAAYVEAGGKVLVIDSPANAGSTTNALLHPFDLRMERTSPLGGRLEVPQGWPTTVAVEAASEVRGAAPFVTIAGRPVAATTRFGEGTVTVIGFGGRFTDAKMGVIGDVIPDATLREVYELEFRLLRAVIGDGL